MNSKLPYLLLQATALLTAVGLLTIAPRKLRAEPTGGDWKPLFNGTDLTGWEADDATRFRVADGQIVGSQNDGKGGNLFSLEKFDNFELRFSYKVNWPANSGIWFRDNYQFDILKYQKPKTFSGAFYYPKCPGTFAWVNADESLENQDDWNQGQIYANGNTIAFWLNGKKLGEKTLVEGSDRIFPDGRIGIQVHGGNFQGMQIAVRSIEIRKLEVGDQPTGPATPVP